MLNSDDRRGLRRSTQPIHERHDAPRPDADGWCGTKLTSTERFIYNFAVSSAAEPPHKVQQQWTTTSCLLTTTGSLTEPHPRLRNGHPDVQGVQRPNMSFARTECFGPHNIEKCIMVKKTVKRYCSNNLKNDYETEINSQDSEHEDKKSDNQYMTRRRPTHITNETL